MIRYQDDTYVQELNQRVLHGEESKSFQRLQRE